MKRFEFDEFGMDNLRLVERPEPAPGPGEVTVAVHALSPNYRDLLMIDGRYNPRLQLPAVPGSDAAGVIAAVGPGVAGLAAGDRVVTNFLPDWRDGPYRADYLKTSLGCPGPGVCAESVVLPAAGVVSIGDDLDFAAAATLPIAALTAWNALVVAGELQSGQTVLTLGTGGVSVFALQIAKALQAEVIVTSSSDDKLERARALGADHLINYVREPRWDKRVRQLTRGEGADVVVENGGAGTLSQSLRSTRAGGTVALLGALTGLVGEVDVAPLVMQRIRVHGVLVGSRDELIELLAFLRAHAIAPVVDRRFEFEELPAALRYMAQGRHFGKIVVERA